MTLVLGDSVEGEAGEVTRRPSLLPAPRRGRSDHGGEGHSQTGSSLLKAVRSYCKRGCCRTL